MKFFEKLFASIVESFPSDCSPDSVVSECSEAEPETGFLNVEVKGPCCAWKTVEVTPAGGGVDVNDPLWRRFNIGDDAEFEVGKYDVSLTLPKCDRKCAYSRVRPNQPDPVVVSRGSTAEVKFQVTPADLPDPGSGGGSCEKWLVLKDNKYGIKQLKEGVPHVAELEFRFWAHTRMMHELITSKLPPGSPGHLKDLPVTSLMVTPELFGGCQAPGALRDDARTALSDTSRPDAAYIVMENFSQKYTCSAKIAIPQWRVVLCHFFAHQVNPYLDQPEQQRSYMRRLTMKIGEVLLLFYFMGVDTSDSDLFVLFDSDHARRDDVDACLEATRIKLVDFDTSSLYYRKGSEDEIARIDEDWGNEFLRAPSEKFGDPTAAAIWRRVESQVDRRQSPEKCADDMRYRLLVYMTGIGATAKELKGQLNEDQLQALNNGVRWGMAYDPTQKSLKPLRNRLKHTFQVIDEYEQVFPGLKYDLRETFGNLKQALGGDEEFHELVEEVLRGAKSDSTWSRCSGIGMGYVGVDCRGDHTEQ